MIKTPVKLQKDRSKNVGGIALSAHKVPTTNSEPRTTESRILCPLAFLRKGGGQQ